VNFRTGILREKWEEGKLKLSRKDMEKIQVYLSEDVYLHLKSLYRMAGRV
jgi:hypothetical protein